MATDEEGRINTLARRMWHRYIQAQPKEDRGDYTRWNELTDPETIKGFRALARVTMSGGWKV
jgi:hypothetical protein